MQGRDGARVEQGQVVDEVGRQPDAQALGADGQSATPVTRSEDQLVTQGTSTPTRDVEGGSRRAGRRGG
ncbi:hypothetical protein [Phenylobacterium sp.]|uniref:hypothetical protein n=1 Tax=Phenylobacterium sp. TaxID=1871053 RepID=UPI00286A56EF|nr:hypothetical protein [Phenylobacterium sp.]